MFKEIRISHHQKDYLNICQTYLVYFYLRQDTDIILMNFINPVARISFIELYKKCIEITLPVKVRLFDQNVVTVAEDNHDGDNNDNDSRCSGGRSLC